LKTWVVLSLVTFSCSLKVRRSFFAYFSTASCESIGGISGAGWQASGGVDENTGIKIWLASLEFKSSVPVQ
jgi:hypothetical protein